ncbi:MAG: ABC transporter permease [Planctomycetes bacterium]|nr:ABC transporter permease [Planctomycetota bacterium]
MAIHNRFSIELVTRDTKWFIVLAAAALLLQVLVLPHAGVTTHLGLALGHLFLISIGVTFVWPVSRRRFAAYLAGYVALFGLSWGYPQKELLMMLFALLYAGTFHSPLLFGIFLIFHVSFVLFPLYALAEFTLGVLLYTAFWAIVRARQGPLVSISFLWGAVLVLFLLLPIAHLCSLATVQDIASTWSGNPDVRRAIGRSVATSTVATLVIAVFGIPFAYAMARAEFAGKNLLLALLDVPILIPQPVIALALLQVLGEKSTLGHWLEQAWGLRFAGELPGIITAQVVVSSPFLVRSAIAGFQEVDPRLEKVARTLGARPVSAFRLVALPLARRGLLTGLILAWARSISEFGSVLILAEHPETAPIMVYHLFIRHGLQEQTIPAVVLLVLVCLWIFAGLHLMRHFWSGGILGGPRLGRTDTD